MQLHFLLNVAVNVLALWSSVFSVQPLVYLTVFLLITKKNVILAILCLLKKDFERSTEIIIIKRKHHSKNSEDLRAKTCSVFNR